MKTAHLAAHQNAIPMGRAAQARAENREIRAFLDEVLPTLQQHEEHAQQLDSGHS
jgi:predicted outer membrane protein